MRSGVSTCRPGDDAQRSRRSGGEALASVPRRRQRFRDDSERGWSLREPGHWMALICLHHTSTGPGLLRRLNSNHVGLPAAAVAPEGRMWIGKRSAISPSPNGLDTRMSDKPHRTSTSKKRPSTRLRHLMRVARSWGTVQIWDLVDGPVCYGLSHRGACSRASEDPETVAIAARRSVRTRLRSY